MGRGMVLNLLDGGHRVRVIANTNREPIDAVVAKGAEEANSLAGLVEGAEVVMLCLNNSRTVERIAAAIKPHMRTRPDHHRHDNRRPGIDPPVGARIRLHRGYFRRCSDDGRPEEALAGETGALVGADDEVFRAIAPLIACYASRIVHFGPVGAGHTAKLISNYLVCGMVALIADTFNTAARAKSRLEQALRGDACRIRQFRSVAQDRGPGARGRL